MKKNVLLLSMILLFCLCSLTVFANETSLADAAASTGLQEISAGEPASEGSQGSIPAAEPTFADFQKDLVAALEARCEKITQLENADMSDKEKAFQIATEEQKKLGRYMGVSFAGKNEDGSPAKTNEEYIRAEYMEGLRTQASLLSSEPDELKFWETWNEGSQRRTNVLEELVSVYGLNIPDEIRNGLDEKTGGYSASGTPEAYQIQALLGVTTDGQPGTETLLALKQRQEELGIPVNGVVNSQRVEELAKALIDQGQRSVIDEANVQLQNQGMDVIELPEAQSENGQTGQQDGAAGETQTGLAGGGSAAAGAQQGMADAGEGPSDIQPETTGQTAPAVDNMGNSLAENNSGMDSGSAEAGGQNGDSVQMTVDIDNQGQAN